MTPATAETATRGRPRSKGRSQEILDATDELLREVGWDNLRMQDVADRAGAGLATIYRRWPTKVELVVDVMENRCLPEIELTGDARTDLRTMIGQIVDDMGRKGEQLAGFLAAANEHPELRAAMRAHTVEPMQQVLAGYIREISGTDHPGIPFVADAVAGVLMVRVGVLGEAVDPEAYADEVLAAVESLCR